jgi:hypothetical protein
VRAPLRVGIVVDSLTVPAWIARIVSDIRESRVASLELVILTPADDRPRASRLYELYTRLDARKYATAPDPIAPVSLEHLVGDVPTTRVTPRTTSDAAELSDTEIEHLLAHRLDVALHFGARRLAGAALGIARHGVWAYHHGDDRTLRGGPPGFWEVMEGRAVTGAILRILTDEPDGGRAIYRSYSSTHPMSVRANQGSYWKASTFVIRKLRDLYHAGPASLRDPDSLDGVAAYGGRYYTRPRTREMIALIARLAARYAIHQVRDRVEYRQWALAYRFGRPSAADKEPVPNLIGHQFRLLVPPVDRIWADPFPVRVDGRHYVLFEECPYATGKGHIALMAIDPDGTTSPPVPVLERDYHLSYPFVFEWQGAQYMVPESSANGTVDLYRATRFPQEWRWERTLIAGPALVDATLAEIGGRWWMFANSPAVPEARYESRSWDELHLFVADSPLGPWTPHPRNPVVSDVRRARPAGRLFQRDGVWYRPAQNCAGLYGAALSLQRITRLDMEAYEEAPVTTLSPSWRRGIIGAHTVNAAGDLTVIDVRLRRWGRPDRSRRSNAA